MNSLKIAIAHQPFLSSSQVPGDPSFFLLCGDTQKTLALGENPAEESVTFEEGEINLILEYLVGGCFIFVTSAAFQDGELFAYPFNNAMFEGIGLGRNQDPPVTSSGLSYTTVFFDRGVKILDMTTRHNLTEEDITAAHVHIHPSGDVICDLASGDTPMPGRSFCRLNESHIDDLEDGNLYVNIHTTANPSGELRANLVFNGDARSLLGASGGLSSSTALALGIGLGVGIPLLLLAIVGIVFIVKKGGADTKI